MYVESIKLNHYRNYDSANISFSPGVNIFYGDNAQGKTNLLEAIYLCATSRSHRSGKDREIIQFGQEEAHIRLQFVKQSLSHRLDVHLKNKKSKGIAMDGVPIRKSSELMGFLHVVFFSPEDMGIIKNGPAGRRKFMDLELGQLDPVYLRTLIQYNKLLVERNNLLKQIYHNPSLEETLDIWDEQLVRAGCEIIGRREKFIEQMGEVMQEIHGDLSGRREKVNVVYEKNISVDNFKEKLKLSTSRDIKLGTTHVGPHRDDIVFLVNGADLRRFGSQGQQRTAALALKLSEIRFVEQITGDKPILLLDDVLSELDGNRQRYLLDSIQETQTMISCTGLDDFVNSRIHLDRIYEVSGGNILEKA